MKKFLFIVLVVPFVLTGCGAGATETMSCSYKNTANNLTTRINYDIDHENDEIKKIRVTYNYENMTNTNQEMDGVGTGTDGTTNDTQADKDGIVDGVVGSAIDSIIGGVTDVILDVAGLKDRHANVQNTYGNINGFSTSNITDMDNNYKVTYIIDYDTITDTDLQRLNLSRNLTSLRNSYVSQGFTCND